MWPSKWFLVHFAIRPYYNSLVCWQLMIGLTTKSQTHTQYLWIIAKVILVLAFECGDGIESMKLGLHRNIVIKDFVKHTSQSNTCRLIYWNLIYLNLTWYTWFNPLLDYYHILCIPTFWKFEDQWNIGIGKILIFEYYGGIIIIFWVHAFTILEARGVKVKVFLQKLHVTCGIHLLVY